MDNMQKVLIVDDEPRNQRIIIEILEGSVEFKTAATGEEALTIADEFCPDLILLDIMMPGITGYEVCKKVRVNPKLIFTKIILISGKATVEEKLKGYESGSDDYMTKPFVAEELLAKTKVFLSLALKERQLTDLNRTLDQEVQQRTSQLIETEAKLVNSAKMSALGEMAGGIAHEINTPLGTIELTAEQISDSLSSETIDCPAIKSMANSIIETVHRINEIIDGLRLISRDGSKDQFKLTPLKEILQSTLSLCGKKFDSHNIKIDQEILANELAISCRPVQISQVLLNLLNNAHDAILPLQDKWIKIKAEKKGTDTIISVIDSGSGIPVEVRQKLFQPFFTTKDIGKGTGLGLSISRGIIEAHKGTLEVDTTCKNTCFVIKLPGDAVQS